MRPLLKVLALAAVATAVAVVVGVACGGDGRLSEQEYFTQLESLMAELRAGEDDLASQNPAPAVDAPLDVMVANLAQTYEAYDGLRTHFAGRLNELRPPSEFDRTHETLVDNAKKIAAGQSEAVRLLGDVRILVDVQAAFRHLYGPTQIFNESCNELQQEADASGMNVDLRCEP